MLPTENANAMLAPGSTSLLRRAAAALLLPLSLLACGGEPSDPGDGSGDSDGVGPDGGTEGEGPDGPWLLFPIEVLGSGSPEEPVVAGRNVGLDEGVAPDDVTALSVLCHRCGFYDSPEFEKLSQPLTRVKTSVRIGGEDAPWLDVTDVNVEFEPVIAAHGGVNGGVVTGRFVVRLDAAARGRLRAFPEKTPVDFRFNGTDGNSNGLRVLDLDFQKESGDSASTFTRRQYDVEQEKEAAYEDADVQAGEALWHGYDRLIKSPIVPRKLRAACSSCHAEDGRDLAYFNYSNESIVQRSRFHGLSDDQGRQIVAYLRSSLYDAVPHVAAATPWNPPYQPGPGLDQKPVHEWAAGAGLAGVLADGKAFVQAFAGLTPSEGDLAVTQEQLDAALSVDPQKPLNTREMSVPLQFPDWNAWLPIVHPLDVWTPDDGEQAGLWEAKSPDTENPQKVFERVRDWLAENANPNGEYGDWSHLTPDQRQQMHSWFNDLGGKTIPLVGGGRGTRESGDAANPFGGEIGGAKLQALLDPETQALFDDEPAARLGFSKQAFIERATFAAFHWLGVKQWELSHRFGLEGAQSQFRGKKTDAGEWVGEGAVRGWPFSWPSVFYMAPHMLYAPEKQGDQLREFYFSWEPRLVSYYRTNQWYQLQMSLNSGWAGASSGPMDWPYHLGFTTAVVDDLLTAGAPDWIAAAHLARYFQIRTKLAQLANTDISFDTPDPNEPENLFKNTGMNSKADLLFKLSATEILHRGPNDWQRTRFAKLDAIAPGLHLMFVNAVLAQYNAFFAGTTGDQYRRCDLDARMFGPDPDDGELEVKSGQRFCLDAARTPLPLDDQNRPYLPGGWTEWTTEQNITWSAIAAAQLGAEPTRVATLESWLAGLY
ncbi:MAG TPA: hypothetical protein VLC09_11870 [Polyangiaceae bacterium]|nr:hypothetical protein [Polyangiaceae bacterium]